MKCHGGRNGRGAQTLILQLYITNPLLYNNRKFDIRTFMLVTCHNGKIKAYWYQEGYVRTSSHLFNLNEMADIDIHLTNDAIQKQSESYGRYEPGNKLSYQELQRYFDSLPAQGRNLDIQSELIPRMKSICTEAVKSSFLFLDEKRLQNNFEVFGLDFMIDWHFNPWLIEINTNPCLELSCPLLERILPHMVENALRYSSFYSESASIRSSLPLKWSPTTISSTLLKTRCITTAFNSSSTKPETGPKSKPSMKSLPMSPPPSPP